MKKNLHRIAVFTSLALILFSGAANASNVWNQELTPVAATDASKPVTRGYIVNQVVPAPGGMEITVTSYHSALHDTLSTHLQIALGHDPRASIATSYPGQATETIELKRLSDAVVANPSSYQAVQKFHVTYDELNRTLEQAFPNSPQLRVAPGSVLFVLSRWQTGHVWGGTGRSGAIVLPEPSDGPYRSYKLKDIEAAAGTVGGRTPIAELDIAAPIDTTLVNAYNSDAGLKGLKLNGQIRSRLEAEGKYDVSESDVTSIKATLFELAQDPAKAAAVLGAGWKMNLEDRYLQRDASTGALVQGSDGFPIPDPMVDTYYDGANFEAAKANAAIRYRWTEGNKTGSWNIKPGFGVTSPSGTVYRVEYGLDATDDTPESVRAFADSLHPLNPFASLRDVIPGVSPADLLKPAVKLTDYRWKFKLEHTSGLIIEMSLDDVHAQALRKGKDKMRYFQLEMDVDHLATQSMNRLAGGSTPNNYYGAGQPLAQYLATCAGNPGVYGDPARAVIRGRPSLHSNEDLDPQSVIRVKKAADFALAETAIVALRDKLFPHGWKAAKQKYAYAAQELGLTDRSVRIKRVKERLRERKERKLDLFRHGAGI